MVLNAYAPAIDNHHNCVNNGRITVTNQEEGKWTRPFFLGKLHDMNVDNIIFLGFYPFRMLHSHLNKNMNTLQSSAPPSSAVNAIRIGEQRHPSILVVQPPRK